MATIPNYILSLIASAKAAVGIETARAEAAEALLAPLASPTFTGSVNIPTPSLSDNSTLAASTAFVVSQVTAAATAILRDRGNYDASVNTFPASGGSGTAGAIREGDLWEISVAGTLGADAVKVNDTIRALVDAPGQTTANWAWSNRGLGYNPLSPANNLSDVASTATALSNLNGAAKGTVYNVISTPLVAASGVVNGVNGVGNLVFTYTTTLLATQVTIFADQLLCKVSTGELASVVQSAGTLTVTFASGQAPTNDVSVIPGTITL